MAAQHFSEGCFARTDITGDSYVFDNPFFGWKSGVHIQLCSLF
jgi:hypothetical protein